MQREDLLCTPQELSGLIRAGQVTVLDCRFNLLEPGQGHAQYREAHIPGAAYVHLDDDLSAPIGPQTGRHPLPDPEDAVALFAAKGVNSGTPVVVYDSDSGAIAARAWWMLRWLGHQDVRLLEGGFSAWQAQRFAVEPGDAVPAAGKFESSVAEGWVIGVEDVVQGLTIPLVDARAEGRFAGVHEPIDPVAGHIPGAVNLPFDRLLNADGRFLAEEHLAQIWVDTVGDDRDVAVMCGSGVTACHLVISALLAGRPSPRLYAGSWSEWIRDATRPIASD